MFFPRKGITLLRNYTRAHQRTRTIAVGKRRKKRRKAMRKEAREAHDILAAKTDSPYPGNGAAS